MSHPDVFVTIKNESTKQIYYSLVFPDSDGLMTVRPDYFPHDVIEPGNNKVIKLEWFLKYITGNKGYDILEIRNQDRVVIFTHQPGHQPGYYKLLQNLTVIVTEISGYMQIAKIPSITIGIWNDSFRPIYWETTGPLHSFPGIGKRVEPGEHVDVEIKYNDEYENYERLQVCNSRNFGIYNFLPSGEIFCSFISVKDEKDEQFAEFFKL